MLKIINIVSLGLVLIVNLIAANSGINGYSTGDISNLYPTLFTPAGFTFSIWSVIYLGLILFCFLQYKANEDYLKKINGLFIAINILNVAWLFCWHYLLMLPALLVMLCLLITLIVLYLRIYHVEVRKSYVWGLKIPFSIYLGWISVATIANVSVYLHSIGFERIPQLLTVIMICVSFTLGMLMIGIRKDLFYGITIIWALIGILIRFWGDPNYQNLVITSAVGIILIVVFTLVKKPKYFSIHSIS